MNELGNIVYYQPYPLQGEENPTSNPSVFFNDEVYFVNRLVTENRIVCDYELSSALELQSIKLPKRQVLANVCTWKYRGVECTYTGAGVADYFDQPLSAVTGVSVNNLGDNCSKKLSGCKLRFGTQVILPFGGFPGSSLA